MNSLIKECALNDASNRVAKDVAGWIEESIGPRPLSSKFGLKWMLDGLTDSLSVQGNLLAALTLNFHGEVEMDWCWATGDIIKTLDAGEMIVEHNDLNYIGQQFTYMNEVFGTTTPEITDDTIEPLRGLMARQLARDIWYEYIDLAGASELGSFPGPNSTTPLRDTFLKAGREAADKVLAIFPR